MLRALLMILGLALVAPTLASAKPARSLEFRFDVRARDTTIAQGRLLVGPKLACGRKSVRAVTIEGHSADLAGVLYSGSSLSTSWLDADWRPLAARWSTELLRRKSKTQATYDGRHLTADFAPAGKPEIHVDRELEERAHDLVSLVPWLIQQKVKPGQQLAGILYVGSDVCRIQLSVRKVEAVAVPVPGTVVEGSRPGLPVDATVSECRVKRGFTVWLDAKDWTPLRMRVADTPIGKVELVLTGVGQVDGEARPLPVATEVSLR